MLDIEILNDYFIDIVYFYRARELVLLSNPRNWENVKSEEVVTGQYGLSQWCIR